METAEAICRRKTMKLRADSENPLPVSVGEEFETVMEELMDLAGKAPFHHQSGRHHRSELDGVEPWRFYAFTSADCRKLLENFKQETMPVKCSAGTMQMLAAADGLILVYWLPEKNRKEMGPFDPSLTNMEHIAATAAAIQNMVLVATARELNIYWSSGGCMSKPEFQAFAGIPEEQILLGAVFLFPNEYPDSVEAKPGKNREARTSKEHWAKWVRI